MKDKPEKKANDCAMQCTIVKELKDQHKDYFYETQSLIYYELPVLISKIFHSAFANCECATPIICPEDMHFIKGFIETTENVFNIAMEGQKKQIEQMLNMHEKIFEDSKQVLENQNKNA